MSKFIEINLTEYNTDDQFDKPKFSMQTFCICCMTKNVKYVELKRCKHARFLIVFFRKKIQETNVVCYNCHKFLINIERFREQIQASLALLQKRKNHDQNPKKLFDYQCTQIELTSTTGQETDDTTPSITSQNFEVKVKVEIDFDSRDDGIESEDINHASTAKQEGEKPDDVVKNPLANSKKYIGAKHKEATSDKFDDTPKSLYDGKITVISLTSSELLAEREADRQKESYLKLPFKCENCIVGFDHELTIRDHMEKRHTEKKGSYTCNVCQSVLNTESSFKEHCKRHYRRYECSACGKRNNTVHAVIKHYNDRHGGDIQVQFTCQDCGFVSKSDRAYRYHREKHKHKQKQQCSECGNTYVNKTALRVHMLNVHQHSNRTYSCAQCNKTYSAKSGLLAHTVSAHEPPSSAYCAQCKTHFRTMTNLRTHLKTHSNHIQDHDKRFQCNVCQVRFARKTSLKEHIDFLHLKKLVHECSDCGKVFKNGASLRKHSNYVHEKKRPPRNKICDHCGRGFTTLAILRSHVRTHTGERPLQCSHCPATFAHSAALYTHNKLLHNPSKPNDP